MERWQNIHERMEATIAVWQTHFPTLMLGEMGLAQFTVLKESLPNRADTRDTQLQTVDGARQAREFSWLGLRLLTTKIPKIIEGTIDVESGLLDDLDKVYAIQPWSPDKTLQRCKVLAPLWAAADAWQLSRMPPRAAIVRNGVTHEAFMSMIAAYFPMSQTLTNEELTLDTRRSELRQATRSGETYSVRFLSAARGLVEPGSIAEAALETIPNGSTSSLPETLGISLYTQGGAGSLQLLITYEPYALEPGDAAELQWMVLDTDTGFTHSAAYDPSGNAIGPFAVGKTVRVRTVVTNTAGTRTGGTRQLTLIAPPA